MNQKNALNIYSKNTRSTDHRSSPQIAYSELCHLPPTCNETTLLAFSVIQSVLYVPQIVEKVRPLKLERMKSGYNTMYSNSSAKNDQ